MPGDVQEYRFWPLGHQTRGVWPFAGRIDRLLVTSPFLADSTLCRIAKGRQDRTFLVSRFDALEALDAATLGSIARSYYMDPAIDANGRYVRWCGGGPTIARPIHWSAASAGCTQKCTSRMLVGTRGFGLDPQMPQVLPSRTMSSSWSSLSARNRAGASTALLGRGDNGTEQTTDMSCFGDLLREYDRGDRPTAVNCDRRTTRCAGAQGAATIGRIGACRTR